jgi:hypothetical protein
MRIISTGTRHLFREVDGRRFLGTIANAEEKHAGAELEGQKYT